MKGRGGGGGGDAAAELFSDMRTAERVLQSIMYRNRRLVYIVML